ncbi:MAG: hypothetical protein JWR59_738 [Brevundimonas sp.]|nr:hypothetical protein [Brevundimonas sp.]
MSDPEGSPNARKRRLRHGSRLEARWLSQPSMSAAELRNSPSPASFRSGKLDVSAERRARGDQDEPNVRPCRLFRQDNMSLPSLSGLSRLPSPLTEAFQTLRRRDLGTQGRFQTWAAVAARVGYGARGFVYLSVGALALATALGLGGKTIGSQGVGPWPAEQPFGRVWLVLLGLGLWAFVLWRALQAIWDADHEGRDRAGVLTRLGQAASGLFYALLAAGVFELLDEVGPRIANEDVVENQEKASNPSGSALRRRRADNRRSRRSRRRDRQYRHGAS